MRLDLTVLSIVESGMFEKRYRIVLISGCVDSVVHPIPLLFSHKSKVVRMQIIYDHIHYLGKEHIAP
jgi:hypothetical protein